MGITWTPPSATPGHSGTASCTAGAAAEWLSVCKSEVISGHISSTHTDQVSCAVTHTCSPAAPPGLIITDNSGTGGIDVSGIVTDIMNTPELVSRTSGILTHYDVESLDKVSYTITVTATWTHSPSGNNTVTPYTRNHILTIYNNWTAEKVHTLYLLSQ